MVEDKLWIFSITKKAFPILLFFLFNNEKAVSQKKAIGFRTYKNWPKVVNAKISNNGNFIAYQISSILGPTSLFLQSTAHDFHHEIKSGFNSVFTEDSRRIIYLLPNDTLGIFDFTKMNEEKFSRIRSYKVPLEGSGEWIACFSTSEGELVLKNLQTKHDTTFHDIGDCIFNRQGTAVLMVSSNNQGHPVNKLLWLDLSDGQIRSIKTILNGAICTDFTFNGDGSQICFLKKLNFNGNNQYEVMNYKKGLDSAMVAASNASPGLHKDYKITSTYSLPRFSKDDSRIFFAVRENQDLSNKKVENGIKVDIWNYKDDFLQSQQIYNQNVNAACTAVLIMDSHRIFQLNDLNDNPNILLSNSDNNALISSNTNSWERSWSKNQWPSNYVASTRDGIRLLIGSYMKTQFQFSPSGDFVIYYDYKGRNYFVYDLKKNLRRNISKSISVPLAEEKNDVPNVPGLFGIGGWLNAYEVLIYDEYDVWAVDVRGLKKVVNLTNGYGRKNKIIFRLLKVSGQDLVKESDKLLFAVFDPTTKENGFFQKNVNSLGDPEKLFIGHYALYFPQTYVYSQVTLSTEPIKSKNSNSFLVWRMSAIEAPNLFYTSDFKTFLQVTHIDPQSKYNWLSAEKFKWKLPSGGYNEGIIYKPENFDSQKKYPVIFYFYERLSDGINKFLLPQLSDGILNIPYFVSNGYIVVVPDIYYKIGSPGESANMSVTSAAKYLSKFPWVDKKKMGLQGHSFGGYEVNYIVTHSNYYSAASSSAGLTNFSSLYNELRPAAGWSNQYYFESGQGRIGNTLWKGFNKYVRNSPIFQAENVKTPLLIMHNKNDDAIPWDQGVEFFTALRRLQKTVWLLQYDSETHNIYQERNQLDFSIRLAQFFDHYLKGAPAPTWMTQGIPARLKQIEDGYELDPAGNCGKDCKVCKMWNEKMKKDSAATMKELQEKYSPNNF